MLIATLPAVHRAPLLRQIVEHPLVLGLRYNVGARSPYAPRETLERLLDEARRVSKPLWIDIKGRQLRVTRWAAPTYGHIVLNHSLSVGRPAEICFRGGGSSKIVEVLGNRIFVDPPPRAAVGEGQAVNIHGPNLEIQGYLTEEDEAYLEACRQLEICDVMLSFVEQASDINAVRALLPEVRPVLKIESPQGLALVAAQAAALSGCRLMAARDDLWVNIGENKADILPALELIVHSDPNAILATRLLSGIEHNGAPALADYCDLRLMEQYGYRSFLLSDGLCWSHFAAAMSAWQAYRAVADRMAPPAPLPAGLSS